MPPPCHCGAQDIYDHAPGCLPTARCRWCGGRLDIEWCDISQLDAPEPRFVRGQVTCPTPGCVPRCPTCHGRVDDIHGPDCGEVMARKLGDLEPCTITRADCGSRMVTA